MLTEKTEKILSIIDKKTEKLLESEEKTSYLFEEGPGPEIWDLVSQSSDFTDDEIRETIEELIQEGMIEKKEVEEVKNRLQGLTPSSSVWHKEKNIHYNFKRGLEKFIQKNKK